MAGAINGDLKGKLEALNKCLAGAGECAIAVSGGLDSRLLAAVAARVNDDVLCVHFTGPHIAEHETEWAVTRFDRVGATYSLLSVDALAHPAVAMNRRDRCYHCKHVLFGAMADHAPDRILMDGSNASDLTKHRPGLRALAESGIHSPLAANGITKPEIRLLAEYMGLSSPHQPSAPCLLTRLPYDTAVDEGKLRRIASLESRCRDLGFTHFRVRLIDDSPILFAELRHRHLSVPIPIEWTDELSGYWDRAT